MISYLNKNMDKTEIIKISVIALIIVALLNAIGMSNNIHIKWLLKLFTGVSLFIVILYWKTIPYKNKLSENNLKKFEAVGNICDPIFNLFTNLPRIKLGEYTEMNVAPLVVCGILILILMML